MSAGRQPWQVEWALKSNLLRRHLGPVAWAQAFRQLAEARGIQIGQGMRNDRTSDNVAEVDPGPARTTANVGALAIELGVSPRTARRRLRLADSVSGHPDVATKLDRGEIDGHRAEELVRDARMSQLRKTKVPERIDGSAYEIRLGDLSEVWADVPDGSVDAIVTDPPYDKAGVPLFEDAPVWRSGY